MNTFQEKIEKLHDGSTLVYVVCTGAGAGCQNILSCVPGASSTLLECLFPYSNQALEDFLGHTPKKFASEETAVAMAIKARKRGLALAQRRGHDASNVVGLGLTAVVGTNRVLRGEHRVFVAICGDRGTFAAHLTFKKRAEGLSLLGRTRECRLCDIFAVNLLLDYAGIGQVPFLERGVTGADIVSDGHGRALLKARRILSDCQVYMPDGQIIPATEISHRQYVLFEGSFNPLHEGHEQVAMEVARKASKEVLYVLSRKHPVKGTLSQSEVNKRVAQFGYRAPVMVTSGLGLFIEKAEAFPGFGFVVGVDTLDRILDPKYYDISIKKMLERFRELGTHFYVSKRDVENVVRDLSDCLANTPKEFHGLFTELSVINPASSTAIRAGKV